MGFEKRVSERSNYLELILVDICILKIPPVRFQREMGNMLLESIGGGVGESLF